VLELDNELPRLTSDRDKVKEVLLNLISNAVKFTSRGSIRLRIQHDGGCILMSLADTGIGIPEGQLGRIFEKFVQISGASPTSRRGTGLGLSIARSFAEMLKGALTVTSVEGQGSTFVLALPDAWPGAGGDHPTTETGREEPVRGAAESGVGPGEKTPERDSSPVMSQTGARQ